jgi:hypothetical protein
MVTPESTRPGQTRKTPNDLSTHESEERGREESVGLYAVCMRERGGWGREGCGNCNLFVVYYKSRKRELKANLFVILKGNREGTDDFFLFFNYRLTGRSGGHKTVPCGSLVPLK